MRLPKLRMLAAVATALALTGCQGLYGVPLPGAVATTGNNYTVTAIFANVMDLVPDSAVKVADVTVGSVTKISLTRDFRARVVMKIKKSVHLPANTVAILQETSLLGEKFVELGPPPGQPAVGRLPENGRALLADPGRNTTNYPDLEQVFGALSLVLNGGGIQKFQTISTELSHALAGHEGKVRDLLTQLTTFVGGLNVQRGEIVRAIEQLDRFTGELAVQRGTIATALTDLGPGLRVLADERSQLTLMLASLSRLGQISSRVIEASKNNTIADINALRPTLTELAAAGTALPKSLEVLVDYPFPHDSVYGIPGDYTNLYATLDVNSLCNVPAIVSANLSQLSGICPLPQTPGGSGTQPPVGSNTPSGPTLKLPVPIPLPSIGSGGGGLGGLLGGLLK